MTTLSDIFEYLGREIGPFQPGTATGDSTPSLLVTAKWPIKSSLPQNSLYADHFIYRPSASLDDQERVVDTYTSASGQVQPDLSWSTAPGNGEAFYLLGTIPPSEMLEAINDALKEILVEVEFTITPVVEQTRHFLPDSVASWLTEPQWIRQVGYLDISEDRNKIDPYRHRNIRGEASKIGGKVVLDHSPRTFSPTNTVLYCKALAPAYYQCAPAAGVFGDQQGLALATDVSEVHREWITAVALVEVWRRHGRQLEASANQNLIRDRQEAMAWKTDMTDEHMDVPPLTFMSPIEHWGPMQSSSAVAWGI